MPVAGRRRPGPPPRRHAGAVSGRRCPADAGVCPAPRAGCSRPRRGRGRSCPGRAGRRRSSESDVRAPQANLIAPVTSALHVAPVDGSATFGRSAARGPGKSGAERRRIVDAAERSPPPVCRLLSRWPICASRRGRPVPEPMEGLGRRPGRTHRARRRGLARLCTATGSPNVRERDREQRGRRRHQEQGRRDGSRECPGLGPLARWQGQLRGRPPSRATRSRRCSR